MYITQQDLMSAFSERTLIELSNDESRATHIDELVIDLAIEYAVETIDGYLRSRYVLPLANVPTIVRNIALQLARYWLYSRRPEGRGIPEGVKDAYKQALVELTSIQSGRLHLGLAESSSPDLVPEPLKFQSRSPVSIDTSGY